MADIHTQTAAKVFNIPEDQVTLLQRYEAKRHNYATLYGGTPIKEVTMSTPNDQDPPEDVEPRKVYISTGDDSEWLVLWDAYTGEQLSTRLEKNRHNLIELATSEGWEVVEGPLNVEDDMDFDIGGGIYA